MNTLFKLTVLGVFFGLAALAFANGGSPGLPNPTPKAEPTGKSQIKEIGATILLDSMVEITGVVDFNRYLDLVETSTPTVPSTNHARIWLNGDGTSSTTLKIIFSDGSIRSIAASN